MIAAFGRVVRVVDVQGQGITYLRVELPVEAHAEATRLFYGKDVLVTLAGPALAGKPYGLHSAEQEEEAAAEPHPRINPAEGCPPELEMVRPKLRPKRNLANDLALICESELFQSFVAEKTGDAPSDVKTGDAAAYMREWCCVYSRADIEHDPDALARLDELLSDYRACYPPRAIARAAAAIGGKP